VRIICIRILPQSVGVYLASMYRTPSARSGVTRKLDPTIARTGRWTSLCICMHFIVSVRKIRPRYYRRARLCSRKQCVCNSCNRLTGTSEAVPLMAVDRRGFSTIWTCRSAVNRCRTTSISKRVRSPNPSRGATSGRVKRGGEDRAPDPMHCSVFGRNRAEYTRMPLYGKQNTYTV